MLHNIYLGLCRLIEKTKTKIFFFYFCGMEMELDFLFLINQLDLNFLKNKQELKV